MEKVTRAFLSSRAECRDALIGLRSANVDALQLIQNTARGPIELSGRGDERSRMLILLLQTWQSVRALIWGF